jgi:hypothetical protein
MSDTNKPRDDRFTSPMRVIIDGEVVYEPPPNEPPENQGGTPADAVQEFLKRKQRKPDRS